MKRSRRSDRSILLLIVIIVVALSASAYGYWRSRTDVFTVKLKEGKPVATLFVVSHQEELLFLDLFLYHPQTNKGGLFYIPANLGSRLESLDRVDRIAVLYDPDKFSPLLAKVEQLVDIAVPFYIDMSLADIVRLVDLVGGLNIFISNPVDSAVAGSRVLLPSGSVLLDGDKIRDFLMYEEPLEEEEERVRRKQKFVEALLRKMGDAEVSDYLLEREPLRYFRTTVHSNLDGRALASFIREMSRLEADSLSSQSVLGRAQRIDGVEGEVLFPHFEGELIKQNIKQLVETITSDVPTLEDSFVVTMEILNGTPRNGLAGRTRVLFESYGFDVVSIGNADSNEYSRTLVIDRKGTVGAAQRVAEVIECQSVETALDPEAEVAVTVILGKDFDRRYCK
jgi:hypothetical protein